MVTIIRLLSVSGRLNEIVHLNNGFKNITIFQISLSIKTNFMSSLWKDRTKQIHKLTFSFRFIDCLYLKYILEALKNEFCVTNVLCHLSFCSTYRVSSSQCRICSRLFVNDADNIFLLLNITFLVYL